MLRHILVTAVVLFSLSTLAMTREDFRSGDGLKVTSSNGFWLAPGETTHLTAASSHPTASLRWEERLENGTWKDLGRGDHVDFQAGFEHPAPCQTTEHYLRAEFVDAMSVKPVEFMIRVQNPKCTLTTKDGLVNNATTKVIIGRGGTAFAGTENGLTQFQWPDLTPTTMQRGGSNRSIEIVTALAQRSNGELWIGRAQDFFLFPIRGFGIEIFDISKNDPWNKDGLVTTSYVSSISFGTTQTGDTFPIILTADNYPLFGGNKGGFYVRNLSQNQLNGESLYAILPLESGLWLLGGDQGLRLFSGGSLERMSGPEWGGQGSFLGIGSNRGVRALAMGIDRTVWVGLKGGSSAGGIIKMENFERVIEEERANKKRDPQAKTTRSWEVTTLPAPAGNDVRAMSFDDENNLWIATNSGLVKRSPDGTFAVFLEKDGIASNDIRDLFYDTKTRYLWVATKGGLTRLSLQQL